MPRGIVAIAMQQGKEYPGELTVAVFRTCFIAAMGGLLFGYDIGISGSVTSMPPCLEKVFPDLYLQEKLNTGSPNHDSKFNSSLMFIYFTYPLYTAAFLSPLYEAMILPPPGITKQYGRRFTMLFGGFLFLVGAILSASAANVRILGFGRTLLGIGVGCVNQSVPIYLSEMAPYKHRGTLNIGFQVMITIGILAANVISYFTAKIEGGWGWRLRLGGAAIPALIIIIGSLCLLETPKSLIERGKKEEAKEILIKIRGIKNVDMELDDLVAASEASKKVSLSWRTLFTKKYRPQLVFAIASPFSQQLTGTNVITFYELVLFKTVGFGSSASLVSLLILGVINCFVTFLGLAIIDKVGRRKLFLEGGAQMLICQIVITSCIALIFGLASAPDDIWTFVLLVFGFICMHLRCLFRWVMGWGPLVFLVPIEIIPLEVRAVAQIVSIAVNMIFTMAIIVIFSEMFFHMRFLFLVSFTAVFAVIMSIVTYFFLPETKGHTD